MWGVEDSKPAWRVRAHRGHGFRVGRTTRSPETIDIKRMLKEKRKKNFFFFLRFEVQIKMRNASVSIEKEVYLPKDLSEKRTCWCAPGCSRHGMQRAALPTCV